MSKSSPKKLMQLLLVSFLVILVRPHPLPSHSNIFSFPLAPLFSPQFTPPDIFNNPLLESFRSLAFNFFTYLSPQFLFRILYPVEIVFVSLGIYYLAKLNKTRLNLFWFGILVISPLISGLLLIVPLSILVAAGLIYLLSQKALLYRFATIFLLSIWLFQFMRQLDLYLIKK